MLKTLTPDALCLSLIQAISHDCKPKEMMIHVYHLYRLTKLADIRLSRMGIDDTTTFGDFRQFLTDTSSLNKVFIRFVMYDLTPFVDFYARIRDFLAPFIIGSQRQAGGDRNEIEDMVWWNHFGNWSMFIDPDRCRDDSDDVDDDSHMHLTIMQLVSCMCEGDETDTNAICDIWRQLGKYLLSEPDLAVMASIAQKLIDDYPLMLLIYQAYIAGLVEYAYNQTDAEPPEWVFNAEYILPELHYVIDFEEEPAPISEFLKRNLYVTELPDGDNNEDLNRNNPSFVSAYH